MEVNFDHNPRFKLHFYSKSFIKLLVLLIQPTASAADVIVAALCNIAAAFAKKFIHPVNKECTGWFQQIDHLQPKYKVTAHCIPEVHCTTAVYLCLSTRIRANDLITRRFAQVYLAGTTPSNWSATIVRRR